MELALISGFCSVKRTGTHLPTPEGWKAELARAEKKVPQMVKSCTAKLGIELGTLCLEGRDLTNCANHVHPYNTHI